MDIKKTEDRIREAADKIQVPDSLQPPQVEEKLKRVNQTKAKTGFAGKRWLPAGIAAACLVLAAGAVWSVAGMRNSRDETEIPVETAKQPENSGELYKQICDSINSHNKAEVVQYAADMAEESTGVSKDVAKAEASSASGSGDFSETDVQVEGVMEGDIVKTDGAYIYVIKRMVDGSKVIIYKAEGKKTSRMSQINLANSDVLELYLEGAKLFAITQKWEEIEEEDGAEEKTAIDVFDISDASAPEKIKSHTQSGVYSTSRLSGGYLYTFSDYYVEGDGHESSNPDTFVPKTDDVYSGEEQIQITEEESNHYTVMTSLKTDAPDKFENTFSSFGDSDVFYVTNNHIYVTNPIYDDGFLSEMRTQITCFSYKDGAFEKGKSVQVRGRINNSYYMHEYNGYFCFVYTREASGGTTNGLCIMEDMKKVGELSGLGKNERIYSSYFIDNMAYFVTYRETDPVFAVDMKNPKKPVLKSELKLPGFSSYLHSFGDGKLVGIGMGEKDDGINYYEAVKMSLFSYDKEQQLKEETSFLIQRDTNSIAGENHRAVFVDEERGLVGLGIERFDSTSKISYQLYQYKKGTWKCLIRQKKISSIEDVRGIRIGDYFYIVDTEKGIHAYRLG